MKTIISLFFYTFLMAANVFFVLETDDKAKAVRHQDNSVICQRSFNMNVEPLFYNFIE